MDHTAVTKPLPRQSGALHARSPYAITYALIATNVLVFAAMVAILPACRIGCCRLNQAP